MRDGSWHGSTSRPPSSAWPVTLTAGGVRGRGRAASRRPRCRSTGTAAARASPPRSTVTRPAAASPPTPVSAAVTAAALGACRRRSGRSPRSPCRRRQGVGAGRAPWTRAVDRARDVRAARRARRDPASPETVAEASIVSRREVDGAGPVRAQAGGEDRAALHAERVAAQRERRAASPSSGTPRSLPAVACGPAGRGAPGRPEAAAFDGACGGRSPAAAEAIACQPREVRRGRARDRRARLPTTAGRRSPPAPPPHRRIRGRRGRRRRCVPPDARCPPPYPRGRRTRVAGARRAASRGSVSAPRPARGP